MSTQGKLYQTYLIRQTSVTESLPKGNIATGRVKNTTPPGKCDTRGRFTRLLKGLSPKTAPRETENGWT
jgi:hypothetical protein